MGTYRTGPFRGVSNMYLNPIMCEGKIAIPLIIKSYILNWYHKYILHQGIYIMEAIICQHLYWPRIRNSVHKEVNNCDTHQGTKRPHIKYGKLTAKETE